MRATKGFSLVELMVTSAISVFIFAGIINVLIASDETVSDTVQRGELQENGRLALKFLTEDILMASYWGHFTGKDFKTNANAGSIDIRLHSDVAGANQTSVSTNDCIVVDERGTDNGTFFNSALSRPFIDLYAATYVNDDIFNGCLPNNVVVGSDLIQVKRLSGEILDPSDANIADDTTDSRYYMHTSTVEATIFAGNDDAPIPQLSSGGDNPMVSEYLHHIYFVGEESRGDYNVPLLRRMRLLKAADANRDAGRMQAQTLVEGIEDLGFMLGVDSDGDDVVNYYAAPSDLSWQHWEGRTLGRVIAVKVFVLVRTITPELGPELQSDLVYDLGSHLKTISAQNPNNYRRMLFQDTIMLINRQNLSWSS